MITPSQLKIRLLTTQYQSFRNLKKNSMTNPMYQNRQPSNIENNIGKNLKQMPKNMQLTFE